jgi:tartrate-resistant acid phosphatase type 5
MLKRLLIVAVILIIAVSAWLYIANYDLFQRVPRNRVGPLHQEVPSGQTLRLFIVGDTGSGNENQYRVAKEMEMRCEMYGVDAILLLGDNAYQGGMYSVDDEQWTTKVEKPYGGPCLKDVPIYAILGNHDYKSNPASQIQYSSISPRWKMPNRFYSVDFGFLLKIVAIDSTLSDFCFNPKFCSLDYMLEALQQPTTIWRLVMSHHPLKTASAQGHGHTGGARGLLIKPFVCNKADFWVAGHAHMLEHRTFDGCSLQHFVSGGGGGDLTQVDPDATDYLFSLSSHGYMELELTREQAVSRFFSDAGTKLYEHHRQREK